MKQTIETGAASILLKLEDGRINITHGTDHVILHNGHIVKAGTWSHLFDAIKDIIGANAIEEPESSLILPQSINNIDDAKIYLQTLVNNGMSYHPDDSAGSIDWCGNGYEPTPAECIQMDKLMAQILSLPECDAEGQFPYGFLMDRERRLRTKDSTAQFMFKDKTGRGISSKMNMTDILDCPNDVADNDDALHLWAEEAEVGDEWVNRTMKFTRIS